MATDDVGCELDREGENNGGTRRSRSGSKLERRRKPTRPRYKRVDLECGQAGGPPAVPPEEPPEYVEERFPDGRA